MDRRSAGSRWWVPLSGYAPRLVGQCSNVSVFGNRRLMRRFPTVYKKSG
ncbi:hypothetical protein [Paenibacillus sp. BC26]|nr:hypothetical protein [Paenibacillus sp. BC26]